MTEPQATDQEPNTSPYLRLPAPVVALALLLFLAAALAIGVYANNNLRPQGIVTPTPAAPPAIAVPVAAPTTTPTSAATPTAALQPTAAPTPQAVAQASPSPATAETPGPLPTVEPTNVAEVEQAYDRYWTVRKQALLDLDKTHLQDVMGGDHLDVISQRIDELRAQNRAILTTVDHDVIVVDVDDTMAHLADDYISDSVYVDPVTRAPLSQPASDEIRVLYTLQKSDGVWKVIDSVQAD